MAQNISVLLLLASFSLQCWLAPMESLDKAKLAIPFFSCFVYAFVAITSSFLTPLVLSSQACNFPAIFNFGDSNSDTGGLGSVLWGFPPSPYGQTYFRRATGRCSDGRLLIDFIAQGLGLPYLDAYLNSMGTNFTHGANFATSGSTIILPPILFPNPGGVSPFNLEMQYNQFKLFMSNSDFIRPQGGVFASLMPKHEYFHDALYTFDIGHNDLGSSFYIANKTVEQVNDSIPGMIDNFSEYVKYFHNLGARYFWIHNTGPIGCLPQALVKFPTAERDEFGCAKAYNNVAQYFNNKLKEAVVRLRKTLSPPAAITYVDVYTAQYLLYKNPQKYGFEKPLEACCGYGEKHNYGLVGCGFSNVVNGSTMFGKACKRPSKRVNWDGMHFTESANRFIFQRIASGAFSDPPIPLNMSCHLPLNLNTT